MPLYTFAPQAGDYAGRVYVLPRCDRANYKTNPDIDKSGSGLQQVAEGTGDYDSSGLNPLPSASGQISAQFSMYPKWLQEQSYTRGVGDNIDLAIAMHMWDIAVMQGGEGILIDVPPAGTVNPLTATPITWWKTSCKIYGQTQVVPVGVDTVTITALFYAQSALWFGSDGSVRTFGSTAST